MGTASGCVSSVGGSPLGPAWVPQDTIEITSTRRLRHRRTEITLHVVHSLPPHVRSRKGLRVTSVERTLLDLGAVCSRAKVENALDDALRQRLTTLGRLEEEIGTSARKGRDGCGVLRGLVRERSLEGRTESMFERALFRRLKEAGLPLPVKQYPVILEGRNCRFDFAYPGHLLAIEAMGYHKHSERLRWEDDQDRHNLITLDGWEVLYVTYRKLCSHPELVIDAIRRALGLAQL